MNYEINKDASPEPELVKQMPTSYTQDDGYNGI
jgi:hypothetical protein